MNWSNMAKPVPRADGTVPARKLAPAAVVAFRAAVAGLAGRRRAALIREWAQTHGVSPNHARRIAAGEMW